MESSGRFFVDVANDPAGMFVVSAQNAIDGSVEEIYRIVERCLQDYIQVPLNLIQRLLNLDHGDIWQLEGNNIGGSREDHTCAHQDSLWIIGDTGQGVQVNTGQEVGGHVHSLHSGVPGGQSQSLVLGRVCTFSYVI